MIQRHKGTSTITLLLVIMTISCSAFGNTLRTRIAMCPEDPPARGVVESVLGSVIGNTLGRLGAALRAAGEAETRTVVVHRTIEMKPGSPAPCLIIAHGFWAPSGDADWEGPGNSPNGSPNGKLVYGLPGVTDTHLQQEPEFVLRLEMKRSTDGSALRIVPTYLEYRDHLTDDRRGNRGLSVEVAFHAPGQPADHKDATGAAIVLGDFAPDSRYMLASGEIEEWDRRRGRWELQDERKFPLQEESVWFANYSPKPVVEQSPDSRLPRILTVTVAETRAARPVLLFLADVFDDSKDELQTALETKLLKSQREAADLAAAAAKNEQLVKLTTAVADGQIALAKYCEMGEAESRSAYLNTRKELFVAMNAANFTARTLNQPLPFATVPMPKAEKPSVSRLCPT